MFSFPWRRQKAKQAGGNPARAKVFRWSKLNLDTETTDHCGKNCCCENVNIIEHNEQRHRGRIYSMWRHGALREL